jgi:hypothetical protein
MRYDTVPSPWPSTVDVKVIQFTGLVARHEHSRATVIASVPEPPDELNVETGAETDASHRAAVGVVIAVDVEAELPHPNAATAPTTAANSRGGRVFTGSATAQFQPHQPLRQFPARGGSAGACGCVLFCVPLW